MSTPFKMTGFSGFGNSPMKQDKKERPLTQAEISASMDTIVGSGAIDKNLNPKATIGAHERLNRWDKEGYNPLSGVKGGAVGAVNRSIERLQKGTISTKNDKKKPSYDASYTKEVAKKWENKGGKAAYIKSAKAYNAKKK